MGMVEFETRMNVDQTECRSAPEVSGTSGGRTRRGMR
jgi:hypothetical protein